MRIREAGEADLDECVALACLAAPGRRSETDWRETLHRDVDDAEHVLFVAENCEAITGYGRAALFEPDSDGPVDTAPRGYYLTGIFVRPAHRRESIGFALTQARLGWIRERDDKAWFFANARNTASIDLHRRFGFEEITRRFAFPGLTFEGGEGILFRARLEDT